MRKVRFFQSKVILIVFVSMLFSCFNSEDNLKIKRNTKDVYFIENQIYKEVSITPNGAVYLLWDNNNVFIGNMSKNQTIIKRGNDTIFEILSNSKWLNNEGFEFNVYPIDSLLSISVVMEKDIRLNNFKYRTYLYELRDSILNHYKSIDLNNEKYELPKDENIPVR